MEGSNCACCKPNPRRSLLVLCFSAGVYVIFCLIRLRRFGEELFARKPTKKVIK